MKKAHISKRIPLFTGIVATTLAVLCSASSASASIFSADFETPTYSTGNLIGQNGWTSTNGSGTQTVVDQNTFSQTVLGVQGDQFVHFTPPSSEPRGGTGMVNTFAAQTEPFKYSALIGYAPGLPTGGNSISVVEYSLSNAVNFNGVIFGFSSLAGSTGFYYRDNSGDRTQIYTDTVSNQLYRIDITVNPGPGAGGTSWDLVLSDAESGTVLASSGDISARGTVASFNTFTTRLTPVNESMGGYLDDMSVTVIPEPGTYGLLAGLAGLTLVGFKRSRRR